MTDEPPPATLDDVIVTGQRARGPSPFSGLIYPSKGNGLGNAEQDEVDPNGGGGGGLSDEQQQCMLPAGRQQWNADAKARAAIPAFRARADALGETDLQNREFGALICDFGNGQVGLGPVEVGPPILDGNGNAIDYPGGRPSVQIDPAGCGGGTPIGFVHSHPGVNTGIPSDDDFAYGQWHVDHNGAPPTFGVYVIAEYQDPQTGNYSTTVTRSGLDERQAANNGTMAPNWVNPEAQPCPGDS